MSSYSKTIDSPIGVLVLTSDEHYLKSIEFDAAMIEESLWIPEVLLEAQKELAEYFSGTRHHFDVPLQPQGTPFQQLVWKQLEGVMFGSTKSYSEIARAIGSENGSRAVGMANGQNPIPIIIPCHRIIGHNGKLTGYAGGLTRKKWLLLHEQNISGGGGLFGTI